MKRRSVMSEDIRVGGMVEVIKYGSLLWENNNISEDERIISSLKVYHKGDEVTWYDMQPYLIGKQGVVVEFSETGGFKIDGIPHKTAWYNADQLRIIKKGVNHDGPHK
ncbi:MAG: hypothetical protein ACEPOW_13960 [Bacteroidales bacterium]